MDKEFEALLGLTTETASHPVHRAEEQPDQDPGLEKSTDRTQYGFQAELADFSGFIEESSVNAEPPLGFETVSKSNIENTMPCPQCGQLYEANLQQIASVVTPEKHQCARCKTHFLAKAVVEGGKLVVQTIDLTPRPSTISARPSEACEPFEGRSSSVVPFLPTQLRGGDLNPQAIVRAPSLKDLEIIGATEACPKCDGHNAKGTAECQHCGLIFARFRPELDAQNPKLVELWKLVREHYDDIEIHERFVQACADTGALTFAANKYGRILSASPAEEIALQMQARVAGLALFKTETSSVQAPWEFRVPRLNNVVLALGGAALTTGLMLPNMTLVASMGAAAIALGIGVRFALRPGR